MKQIFSMLVFLVVSSIAHAQDIKLFYENKEQGYILYATNPELYPVSVSLELKITNLNFSEGEKKVFVISPKTEKYKIGELTVAEAGAKYKFSYMYKSAVGDVLNTTHDKSTLYDLPFQKSKSYKVHQGYNGAFSHQHENSLDFTMPEGTEILTAREGIVVQLIQNNTESCPKEECKKYNNYITIMHADGTFATYAHIKYNGAKFKIGDTIKRGDVIALSGNVGWTSGPHLHFVCYIGGFDKRNTLETKFKINNGDDAVLLSEGNAYQRNY